MKFFRKIKPSKVLGSRTQQHAIQGAMVEMEKVMTQVPGAKPGQKEPRDHLVLYATNSYSFVRIDLGLKDSMDEPGPIPAEALRHMEKGVTADLGMDEVRVGITRYERVSGDFPNGDRQGKDFPDFEKVISKAWPRDPQAGNKLTININPKLLMAACEAIGETENVQIILDLRNAQEYPGQKRKWYSGAMKMKPYDEEYDRHKVNEAEAYLMPIKPIGHGDLDPSGGRVPGGF